MTGFFIPLGLVQGIKQPTDEYDAFVPVNRVRIFLIKNEFPLAGDMLSSIVDQPMRRVLSRHFTWTQTALNARAVATRCFLVDR
ncbi:hypothetical protein V3C99_001629 [Haemonchus contortus]